MKTIFFCSILFLCSILTNAQYVNTTAFEAREIQGRILLVCLPEYDKELVNLYEQENPDYVRIYKTDIDGQRKALLKAILEHWTFNDSVQIISLKEAKSLIRKNFTKYALMKVGEQFQNMRYYSGKISEPPVTAWIMKDSNLVYDYNSRSNIRILGITSLVIELPQRAIEVYLPKMSPSEGDFIYALHQMDYVLSTLLKTQLGLANKIYRNTGSISKELKNKTLLLDGTELGSKVEEIQKVYPYPFKIARHDIIEKALQSKDTNYVFIQNSRYDPNNSTYYISNVGDGTIYGYFNGLTFDYGEQYGTAFKVEIFYPRITTKHIGQLIN